jgi:hypothetical protein
LGVAGGGVEVNKRRRFKIYMAGAIQGANLLESLANIEHGNQWTARVFAAGFSPFPVFSDEAFLRIVRPVPRIEDVYAYSMEWLAPADAMMLIPGWAASRGANLERKEAERLSKPVFESIDELCAWADGVIALESIDPVREAERIMGRSDD